MRKAILITIFVILLAIAIFSNFNYFYFNKRIENIEKAIQDKLIDTDKLKMDIENIKDLSYKLSIVDKQLENIKVKKIDCIDYLSDVAITSNDFLIYSKSIYDFANKFLQSVKRHGLNTVSVKEISDIENEIDEKNNKISELSKENNLLIAENSELESQYDELTNEYNELKKTLFKLTAQN
jgi:uncharacterized coiled-coil DUF342 family protein